MSNSKKSIDYQKREASSSYFKLIIILLLLLLTVLVSSQIKYRLSSQSKAQVNLPPLPTIDINPQISIDLPQVDISLPALPEIDINLPIAPINVGIGGRDDSQPPIEAPSNIPLKETGDFFTANILPLIINNLPPGVAEIAQGFFAVIGGRGISPPSDNIQNPIQPTSSPWEATPYPAGNRIPTVLPTSFPTAPSPIGYETPTIPPIITNTPTTPVDSNKTLCTKHVNGKFCGCGFGICNCDVPDWMLKPDQKPYRDETTRDCRELSRCTVQVCNQEVKAADTGGNVNWSRSYFTCTMTPGANCN